MIREYVICDIYNIALYVRDDMRNLICKTRDMWCVVVICAMCYALYMLCVIWYVLCDTWYVIWYSMIQQNKYKSHQPIFHHHFKNWLKKLIRIWATYFNAWKSRHHGKIAHVYSVFIYIYRHTRTCFVFLCLKCFLNTKTQSAMLAVLEPKKTKTDWTNLYWCV